ncbi:TPA: MipA/OmpV family protein [Serratia rubidaea]|nr:MipA/OmpV family protein [Serratia rubidaea]HDJ1450107.1 MipA/OmpV family protein [Serratia rubidaea]HDJ1463104.1 MipA/OmpV family protein [Serratia rubidaea]HDJ2774603.1 MipA/OmpV family protein [Serratia rubidaea]
MKGIKRTLSVILFLPFVTYASSVENKHEITVGIGTQYAPTYIGADKYDVTNAPYFEWTNGSWFVSSEKGIGITHSFDNGLYLGQALGYTWGRTTDGDSWLQSGSDHLKGMGKINTALNSTTTLGWWMTPWFGVEGTIIAPLTESQGVNYNIGVNAVLFNDDSNTLTASGVMHYGDARYNNTWFGVNEKQSRNSEFKSFNSTGGLYSVDYSINWQHLFNENWSGYAALHYTTLANHVRHSPIVQKDDYFTFTIGAFYSF